MILGMSLETFTLLHVAISLVALVAGLVVLSQMLSDRDIPGWTGLFLGTTLATTVTGFMFPIATFTPAVGVGLVSLAVLIPAFLALYVFQLAGVWRVVYVVGALAAFYLNAFVAVVQAFQKIETLAVLAPNQSEPPFVVAQSVLLAAFVIAGILATKRFHPGGAATAS